MKKIIIYYIHSFNVSDADETKLFDDDSKQEPNVEAFKAHPDVQTYESMADFIHDLNVQNVDNYGVFAFEEVEQN